MRNSPPLQPYNGTVAAMQGLFAESCGRPPSDTVEAVRINGKIVQALAQGVAVYAQELRRPQLVAAGFAQGVLEQRPFNRCKRAVIERTRWWRLFAEPRQQSIVEPAFPHRLVAAAFSQHLPHGGHVDLF